MKERPKRSRLLVTVLELCITGSSNLLFMTNLSQILWQRVYWLCDCLGGDCDLVSCCWCCFLQLCNCKFDVLKMLTSFQSIVNSDGTSNASTSQSFKQAYWILNLLALIVILDVIKAFRDVLSVLDS
jgi:hypothetical protein